jgi:hypothetical protein
MENTDSKTAPVEAIDRNAAGKKWQFRRTVIVMTLMFCATVILYLTLYGDDTRLNETIALGAFGLTISVIGSAIFGAVWDDKNTLNKPNR